LRPCTAGFRRCNAKEPNSHATRLIQSSAARIVPARRAPEGDTRPPPRATPLARRPQFAGEPPYGVGLHWIDGHGNFFSTLAGGAFERPLLEPACAGGNSRQRHPVLAHRTHWPIADRSTHNLTPGSQAADLLFFNYGTSGSFFKRLYQSVGTAGAGPG
jgi:hypothetical protein